MMMMMLLLLCALACLLSLRGADLFHGLPCLANFPAVFDTALSEKAEANVCVDTREAQHGEPEEEQRTRILH